MRGPGSDGPRGTGLHAPHHGGQRRSALQLYEPVEVVGHDHVALRLREWRHCPERPDNTATDPQVMKQRAPLVRRGGDQVVVARLRDASAPQGAVTGAWWPWGHDGSFPGSVGLLVGLSA